MDSEEQIYLTAKYEDRIPTVSHELFDNSATQLACSASDCDGLGCHVSFGGLVIDATAEYRQRECDAE